MARSYQVHGSVSSSGTINYHFICEKCGNDSGNLSKVLKHTVELNATNVEVERTNNELHVSQKSVNEAKTISTSAVNSQKFGLWNDAVYKKIYYSFKDKCPHCGKHQSWGNHYLYWYNGFSIGGIIGGIVGWGVLWAILVAIAGGIAIPIFGKKTFEFFKSINIFSFGKYIQYCLIIGALVTPILTLIEFIVFKTRTWDTKEKHIPVIDWNDATLNEKAKEKMQ